MRAFKYRTGCSKFDCYDPSDVIYFLKNFGPVYFCANHGRLHLNEYLSSK